MAVKKHYQIALADLPGSERIVFKLIFSVSTRIRGRQYSYGLLESDSSGRPDLLIVPAGGASAGNGCDWAGVPCVEIIDHGTESGAGLFLQRPLIATRVIGILDAIVAQRIVTGPEALTAAAAPGCQVDSYAGEHTVFPVGVDVSELAIVHDDTLTHPANHTAPCDELASQKAPAVEIGGQTGGGKVLFPPTTFSDHRSADSVARWSRSALAGACPVAKRALVVDDSGSVRKQLELELALFEVEADYAADAAGAFALLKANRYDVVFLDVVLPDRDGFEICKSIKADCQDTTVIMLTSKATQADKLRGSLAGCDAYLVKPVGRVTFQNTVRNHLPLLETAPAAGVC